MLHSLSRPNTILLFLKSSWISVWSDVKSPDKRSNKAYKMSSFNHLIPKQASLRPVRFVLPTSSKMNLGSHFRRGLRNILNVRSRQRLTFFIPAPPATRVLVSLLHWALTNIGLIFLGRHHACSSEQRRSPTKAKLFLRGIMWIITTVNIYQFEFQTPLIFSGCRCHLLSNTHLLAHCRGIFRLCHATKMARTHPIYSPPSFWLQFRRRMKVGSWKICSL